jgi:hypothetical protein
MKGFKITYSIVTPESAEIGDFAETGWIDEDGVVLNNVEEAIDFLKNESGPDGILTSSWPTFGEFDWFIMPRYNYETREWFGGREEERSFHPFGWTIAELQQIKEAVCHM